MDRQIGSRTDQKLHSPFVKVGFGRDFLHVIRGHILHPNGLPDAALGRVEHAAPLQLLFASGMTGGVAEIPHGKDQLPLGGSHAAGCDIHGKRKVAACVARSLFSVYVYPAGLVYCPEVQEQTTTRRRFMGIRRQFMPIYGQFRAIPQVFIGLQLPVDAG